MTVPSLIQHNMEVLGCDGTHVGVVDHVAGSKELMLAKNDPDAGGEPHFIPLSWVMYVGHKIHLRQPGEEAKSNWKTG